MKLAILKECRPGEARVAGSPDVVRKLIQLGFEVAVESGAGAGASFSDATFRDAGASIAENAGAALESADVIFKVQRPIVEGGAKSELASIPKGALLIANLQALAHKTDMEACAEAGITAFAVDLMPRITRAQSMDVLSSQSNLTGYRAVLDAAVEIGRAFPMMMTAAGTIAPAKVLVIGAGVAGLQAIATAKRLGAVVTGYDVRASVKEQVESLGGRFLEVDPEAAADAETEGGYAKEMSAAYQKKQAEALNEALKKQDVAICTALIPGKPAPVLITEDVVKGMKPGSVIVDLAVEAGGNCELSVLDEVVTKHGVKIVGHGNVPSRLAEDASALYARNLLNFITLLVNSETKSLAIDWDDEIVKGTLVSRDGKLVNPLLEGEGA
jgi:NAD(P) transhydrogenase subunit alpha